MTSEDITVTSDDTMTSDDVTRQQPLEPAQDEQTLLGEEAGSGVDVEEASGEELMTTGEDEIVDTTAAAVRDTDTTAAETKYETTTATSQYMTTSSLQTTATTATTTTTATIATTNATLSTSTVTTELPPEPSEPGDCHINVARAYVRCVA